MATRNQLKQRRRRLAARLREINQKIAALTGMRVAGVTIYRPGREASVVKRTRVTFA